jgi:Bacterial mobilisation protein (MobC)
MPTANRRTYNAQLREAAKASGVRRVSATVSPTEYAQLAAAASAAGERVTSHLKTCAFAYLDSRYIVPADIQNRLDDLVAIMRGIGNNLNQLARHSNEMRYFLDTKEVQLQIRRLEEEIVHFVTAPPRSGPPDDQP